MCLAVYLQLSNCNWGAEDDLSLATMSICGSIHHAAQSPELLKLNSKISVLNQFYDPAQRIFYDNARIRFYLAMILSVLKTASLPGPDFVQTSENRNKYYTN